MSWKEYLGLRMAIANGSLAGRNRKDRRGGNSRPPDASHPRSNTHSRHSVTAILGILLVASPFVIPPAAAEGGDLILYLPFDEGAGTVAFDRSGNGNDGTILGGAGFVPGRAGSALAFDGSDDLVRVTDDPTLHTTAAITFEFWLKVASYPPNAVRLIQKDFSVPGGPAWSQFLLYGDPGVGTGVLQFRPVTDGAGVSTTPSQAISLTRWYCVDATYDAATSLSRIYVDGALAAENMVSSGPIPQGTAPLDIGRAGWVTTPFHGALDELRIYGRALTGEEIGRRVCARDPVPCDVPHERVPLYSPQVKSDTEVTLYWGESTADPATFEFYEVHKSTDTGFSPMASTFVSRVTNQEMTWYAVLGLQPDTPYYFRVLVYDGCDQPSNEGIGTTDVTNPPSNLDRDHDTIPDATERDLSEKYLPILAYDTYETFFPTTVDFALAFSDIEVSNIKGPTHPLGVRDVESRSRETYLDNVFGTHSDVAGITAKYLQVRDTNIDGHNPFEPTAYSHVVLDSYRDPGGLDPGRLVRFYVIQYWYYYPFNDGSLNSHEGDWEWIQVAIPGIEVGGNLEPQAQPKFMFFSQHWRGVTVSWADVEKAGDRPKAYVARGSHAFYPDPCPLRCGPYLVDVTDGRQDATPSFDLVALGEKVLQPGEMGMHLREIGWLDFAGHWGEEGSDCFWGTSGPPGPVFWSCDGRRTIQWENPMQWMMTWRRGRGGPTTI